VELRAIRHNRRRFRGDKLEPPFNGVKNKARFSGAIQVTGRKAAGSKGSIWQSLQVLIVRELCLHDSELSSGTCWNLEEGLRE